MDSILHVAESEAPARTSQHAPAPRSLRAPLEVLNQAAGPAAELGIWLRALGSFLNVRNHPLTEVEYASVLARDYSNEVHIVRRALLAASRLTFQLVSSESSAGEILEEDGDDVAALDALTSVKSKTGFDSGISNAALIALAQSLGDLCNVCEAMLEARAVGLRAWTSVGRIFAREMEHLEAAHALARIADHYSVANLPVPLNTLAREAIKPDELSADISVVFSTLAGLLGYLRLVESFLHRDEPLKQTLPIFTLVHEEARHLQEFIETRAMRTEGLSETIFDALDGTNYAITMELRKVFAHELVGLSALRQAPPIYAKVESAHGLLRDSFQQSIVALAQLWDAEFDSARLFNSFQTKLEQSIALRNDLWTLLQLVGRAEKERDLFPIAQLVERLEAFSKTSLRYLMYKDWEACERFIEEAGAARGAIELAPVLNRFGAYLETLHGQVGMRAVLAGHQLDYKTTKV